MDSDQIRSAREAGSRRSTLERHARRGRYVRFYAGVFIPAEAVEDPSARIVAAVRSCPGAVVAGRAALFACGWADLRVGQIQLLNARTAVATTNLRATRRRAPHEWVADLQGIPLCRPAFAVADLAGTDDGHAIDRFLREGGSLADIETAAATMVRWPNAARRRAVIKASRTLPWSAAERLLHRILLDAGIKGWVANLRISVAGRTYFLDVGFKSIKLALEADGYEMHLSHKAFVADRERQNALVLSGWTVLRFSWSQLQNPERVAADVSAAIRAATGARSA